MGYVLLGRISDEELARAQVERLAATVSFSEPVGNPTFRAAHLNGEFKELLTPRITITVPEVGNMPSERNKLALATARVQAGFGSLEVGLDEVVAEVGGEQATVRAIAVVEQQRRGVPRSARRPVTFSLTKVDGDWLIDAIRVDAPLDDASPTDG